METSLAVIIEIILVAISLSMDAFAVSVGKGLSTRGNTLKTAVICGLWFGAFQLLMPLIGWSLGSLVESFLQQYGKLIGFVALAFIGGKMIKDAISDEEEPTNSNLNFLTMLIAAIATSIDALFVGITYISLNVNIIVASTIIGVVSFINSFVGCYIGNKIGTKFDKPATIAGGVILILIALKILIF